MSRITDETIERARNVDMLFLAQQMGEQLKRVGENYFTYRNGGERTPSLAINPVKHIWKDFGGVAGGNDSVSFYCYRKFDEPFPKDKRFIEAVKEICELCGITIQYSDGSTQEFTNVQYQPRREIHEDSSKADEASLHKVYYEWMKLLPLKEPHVEHLQQIRKIPHGIAQVRGYRSLGDDLKERYKKTKELLNRVKHLEGIPGFIQKQGKYGPYWTAYGRAGMLIPFRSIEGLISGYQIMYDDPPVTIQCEGEIRLQMSDQNTFMVIQSETGEVLGTFTKDQLPVELEEGRVFLAKGKKYGWFSVAANPQKGILAGAEIGNPAPYHTAVPASVLVNWIVHKQPLENYMDTSTIWWGEGPLKGDIATEFTKQVHLQVPGVNQWRLLLEPTKALRPNQVIFAFDADAQTKEDTVQENVLRAIEGAKQELSPLGIDFAIALWPIDKGKGLDDLMNAGYKPRVIPIS